MAAAELLAVIGVGGYALRLTKEPADTHVINAVALFGIAAAKGLAFFDLNLVVALVFAIAIPLAGPFRLFGKAGTAGQRKCQAKSESP